MSTFLTLYTLSGLVILGVVIVKILLDNTFSKKDYIMMSLFPFHTFVGFITCLVSYSTIYYLDKKRNGDEK